MDDLDFTDEYIIKERCLWLRFYIKKHDARLKRVIKSGKDISKDEILLHWHYFILKTIKFLKLQNNAITWTVFGSKRFLNKRMMSDFDLYYVMKENKQIDYTNPLWNKD